MLHLEHMISVNSVVKKILEQNPEIADFLNQGLLNRSEYARTIQKEVKKLCVKEVSLKSIVVALTRLEGTVRGYELREHVPIDQLSIFSPLIDIIFIKTKENLSFLGKVADRIGKLENQFFIFSVGTQEISITVSEELEKRIVEMFSEKPYALRRNLAAVSIRFSQRYISEANVGLYFHKLIGRERIPLDKVVTTNSEFTLIFHEKYLDLMIKTLNAPKIKSR